jgi:hypothetical protein
LKKKIVRVVLGDKSDKMLPNGGVANFVLEFEFEFLV